MECRTMADVEEILQEIYYRLDVIEQFLADPASKKPRNQQAQKYTGHKTKYGTYIDSASGEWLHGFFNKAVLTLYKETIHHARCCMCGASDISLTAKTYRHKGKDYIIPLCDDCTDRMETTQKITGKKKKPSPRYKTPRARIYYNPVETNRRKF